MFYPLAMKKILRYFTPFEWSLWLICVSAILIVFFVTGSTDYLQLCCAIFGVTSLAFMNKASFFGPILLLAATFFYAYVSYQVAYYGELVISLALMAPLEIVSIVSWLTHRYGKKGEQVQINHVNGMEIVFAVLGSALLSFGFYFLLRHWNTNNLLVSTLSIFTSALGAYFQIRRSRLYALSYGANDLILILLWTLMCLEDIHFLPMVVYSVSFLANDIYGFINWTRIQRRQKQKEESKENEE